MTSESSYTSPNGLSRQFSLLGQEAYYDKIRFFEKYEDNLSGLPIETLLTIEIEYIEALYFVERYHRVIKITPTFIEKTILNNISKLNEVDVYKKALQILGVAHYKVNNLSQSIHIAKELLKMDASRNDSFNLLFQCYRKEHAFIYKGIKACVVFAVFSSITLIIIQQIVIHSFYPDYSQSSLNVLGILFGSIFGLLIASRIIMDVKNWMKAKKNCRH